MGTADATNAKSVDELWPRLEIDKDRVTVEGKLIPMKFVDVLANYNLACHFVTPTTDLGGDVMWLYNPDTGIYTPEGIPFIEKTLQEVMGEKTKRNQLSEAVKLMQVKTYTQREQFNEDPGVVVLENGTFDLIERTIVPNSYLYNQKQRLGFKYLPEADCPEIKQFLKEVIPEDVETIQEIFGYLLLKDYRFQKSFLFSGVGANGKTTLLNLVEAFLSPGNVSHVSLYELTSNKFSAAELYGKLSNISPDVAQDEMKRTGTFKALCGGDAIKAERKHRDPFTFRNYAKLFFSCNQLPTSPDQSNAFFRRFLVFEFQNVFEPAAADPEKIQKLTTPMELSGLFNWALEGLDRLLDRGYFLETRSVEETREYYMELADPLTAFVNLCVMENQDGIETKDGVYYAYNAFCKRRGFVAIPKNHFGMKLKAQLYVQETQRTIDETRIRCYTGLTMRCTVEDGRYCTGCTGCTGYFNIVKKTGIEIKDKMPVQPVQPVQETLLEVSETREKLLDYIRARSQGEDPAREYEMMEEFGLEHQTLKKLLQILQNDRMAFMTRPGVWRVAV